MKDNKKNKESKENNVLKNEIIKTLHLLEKIEQYFSDFNENIYPKLKRSTTSALVYSQIFENYYTCLETLFLRISQFFENSLSKEKWHTDLINKMNLQIDEIRDKVISDSTYLLLLEFMRFRHFKRYYFQFDYDWDRVDFLLKKFEELKLLVKKDLKNFSKFVDKLKT